jgi:ABC-type branched-subunit amino acid transport system substrate-binding protein
MPRATAFRLGLLVVLAVALLQGASNASAFSADPAEVVIHRGRPVQVAVALNVDASRSFANAIEMAVRARPRIHGFRVQLNFVDAPCGDPTGDVAAATRITSDPQNVAVLGQMCSVGFDQALPIYQAAGLVTITGSATNDALPSYAPTVFDRTVVGDGDGLTTWYASVQALPTDVSWRGMYAAKFGSDPWPFADLYFDATSLLLARLRQVSHVVHRSLVINRAALAQAVRTTTSFPGVSCIIRFDRSTGDRVNEPAALTQCQGASG